MKPIVLYFQSSWSKSWRDKLSGVYRFADSAGWHVQVIENRLSPSDVLPTIRRWHPIGCLVDRSLQNGRAPTRIFGKTPVVFLDQNPLTAVRCTGIIHDSKASALMAISELRKRGLNRLAYVSWDKSRFWDNERRTAVREYAEANGLEHFETSLGNQMEQWLLDLPKPCGIVCASDITAQQVISTALLSNIAVPDEIAVVGIDNDEGICEHTNPTLTSVAPDFFDAGYRLGELLQRRIRHPNARHVLEAYGPREIVIRESSQWMPSDDPRTRKALAYIKNNLADPKLDVRSVISAMHCSRTLADRLFQRAFGHSIMAEIHHQRVLLACRLLRNPRQKITPIPSLCGYLSEPFFKCLFKKTLGMSMREWRKSTMVRCSDENEMPSFRILLPVKSNFSA